MDRDAQHRPDVRDDNIDQNSIDREQIDRTDASHAKVAVEEIIIPQATLADFDLDDLDLEALEAEAAKSEPPTASEHSKATQSAVLAKLRMKSAAKGIPSAPAVSTLAVAPAVSAPAASKKPKPDVRADLRKQAPILQRHLEGIYGRRHQPPSAWCWRPEFTSGRALTPCAHERAHDATKLVFAAEVLEDAGETFLFTLTPNDAHSMRMIAAGSKGYDSLKRDIDYHLKPFLPPARQFVMVAFRSRDPAVTSRRLELIIAMTIHDMPDEPDAREARLSQVRKALRRATKLHEPNANGNRDYSKQCRLIRGHADVLWAMEVGARLIDEPDARAYFVRTEAQQVLRYDRAADFS